MTPPRSFPEVGELALPASPSTLMQVPKDASPVLRAYYLQLLGALHPWYSEHARDRAFVRSLLLLDEVHPDSPDYRLLRGRALLYLQRRPLAIKAIGEPRTPAENALVAVLNGNLPEMEKWTPQIRGPLARLLGQMELSEFRTRYDALPAVESRAQLAAMLNNSPDWKTLVLWRARDWDNWFQRSNLELKAMLDRSLPTPGPTAETLIQAQATLNEFDPRSAELELSVYNHTNKLLTSKARDWCCLPTVDMPNRWDYLDLISELAETNLLRRVEFHLKTQAAPESAERLLARYESVYKDHPPFTSMRAWTDWKLAAQRQGAERDNLIRQALDTAMHAAYWSQGQTWAAWDATRLQRKDMVERHPPMSPEGMIWTALANAYIGDWPIRWYWPVWEQGGVQELLARNAIERVAYSTHPFSNLTEAMELADEAQQKQLMEQAVNRFVGDRERIAFLVKQTSSLSDPAAKKKIYEEAMRATPNAWEPYFELGKLAAEEGDYARALKTFQSYPGFAADSKHNQVSLSQYAFSAGSELYWRGAIPEAVALYELSAGYDTGSWGSMTSATRLTLLDADYRSAAEQSLQRAQRYKSKYAYRDFLDLLHVLGRSQDAWPAFQALMEQFPTLEVWDSALIGLRIKGTNEADFERWILTDGIKDASVDNYRFAPHLAILWNVVDRKPGAGFAKLVEQLDSPPQYFVDQNSDWTVQGDPASRQVGGRPIVGPSEYKAEGRPKRAPGSIVRSRLAYFAEAYTRLRNKDFAGANRTFEEMARHYWFEGSYAAAYFARAAAKSGNGESLERYLDGKLTQNPITRFDFNLAKAFFASARGQQDQALKYLAAALNTRPETGARPIFTEYQFVEACEWLYEDTNNAAFRNLALDWARKHQRLAPMYSWAYAVEARFATSPEERMRALAITLYLDPNSERASRLSPAERQRAKEWLNANNPFLRDPGKRNNA